MTEPRRSDGLRSYKRLAAAEARRALFIDFEGGKDQPPVLLGILRRGGQGPSPFVHQVVVDPVFAGLGCPDMTLSKAVEIVVTRAESRDRRIVSWSEHDLNVVATLRDDHPELVARFERRYANARAFAEYWRNKVHHGDKPETGRLKEYLDLVGYEVPDGGEAGNVGETIGVLRPTLEAGRLLTLKQRERWDKLLEHNRHDCAGMRVVCLRAADELEATED